MPTYTILSIQFDLCKVCVCGYSCVYIIYYIHIYILYIYIGYEGLCVCVCVCVWQP